VVNDDNTVAVRPVVVQKQDETQTVIKSGLDSNERVVTTGFVRLTDGSRISIGTPDTMPAQDARPRSAQRPDGKGERKQRGGSNTKSNSQQ